MELTNKQIQLLAQLSRDRGLCAECKGAELDALQELGLLEWFDARSSTTPFKQDPRPLLRLHGISGRIDYAWVAAVENWRELVGPEVSAKVDAIGEIEWAVNSGLFTGPGQLSRQGLAQRLFRAPSPARDVDRPSRPAPRGVLGSARAPGHSRGRLTSDHLPEGARRLADGNWRPIGTPNGLSQRDN